MILVFKKRFTKYWLAERKRNTRIQIHTHTAMVVAKSCSTITTAAASNNNNNNDDNEGKKSFLTKKRREEVEKERVQVSEKWTNNRERKEKGEKSQQHLCALSLGWSPRHPSISLLFCIWHIRCRQDMARQGIREKDNGS